MSTAEESLEIQVRQFMEEFRLLIIKWHPVMSRKDMPPHLEELVQTGLDEIDAMFAEREGER